MEPRDRLINIATLACAALAWVAVAVIVTTQDPRTGQAGFIGAVMIGVAFGLTATPVLWLLVFGRHARIAYRGDWTRAFRRGGWIAFAIALFVLLRIENAISLPIALFVLVLVCVAEATLSVDR